MEEKKCPVDRGKLLIGMECCNADPSTLKVCSRHCPYWRCSDCVGTVQKDALAYIGWLEEQLGVTG